MSTVNRTAFLNRFLLQGTHRGLAKTLGQTLNYKKEKLVMKFVNMSL